MPVVLLDVEGPVATVTLNRPERRNALSGELLRDLHRLLGELDQRSDIRAIVLTGTGPAFCAGLDLTELAEPGSALAGTAVATALPGRAKPLIGAVNGPAVTGGLELALSCDFLIASERAAFADTHARIGIQPGWGLTVQLPEAIGLRRAREMSATGNFVDAQTALSWGLVNHVVPHADLLPVSQRLAADAASADAEALRAIFTTYADGALVTRGEAIRLEAQTHARWHASGINAGQVRDRRDAIIERGRSQQRSGQRSGDS
jgi:enoyl-CoA hydratase/carnithine racemase